MLTINELRDGLQSIYDKYGDMDVMIQDDTIYDFVLYNTCIEAGYIDMKLKKDTDIDSNTCYDSMQIKRMDEYGTYTSIKTVMDYIDDVTKDPDVGKLAVYITGRRHDFSVGLNGVCVAKKTRHDNTTYNVLVLCNS